MMTLRIGVDAMLGAVCRVSSIQQGVGPREFHWLQAVLAHSPAGRGSIQTARDPPLATVCVRWEV